MSISRCRAFSITASCFWLLVVGGTISTQAQTRSYVAHPDGAITVLDTETNAVVDTITVCPQFNCRPLIPAATPNGLRLYVTNNLEDTVWVIDTISNTVVDTITVGNSPWAVAITPNGKRAYVANSDATISVIDTSTNRVIDTIIDLDISIGIAITPDGTRAYVSNGAGTVSVVDTSTNTITATIPVLDSLGLPDRNLVAIVLTPDGSRAYVISNNTGQIYVIDTATNTVTTSIPTDPGPPFSIAMSPDGSTVYTASFRNEARAFVVDTFTNTILTTISAGGPAPFVGVTPDGGRLYIDASDSVTIIDTSTNTIMTEIHLGREMGGVAFTTLPEVPHSKDDCRDNGFQRFTALGFENQGQCVKFVNEHAN